MMKFLIPSCIVMGCCHALIVLALIQSTRRRRKKQILLANGSKNKHKNEKKPSALSRGGSLDYVQSNWEEPEASLSQTLHDMPRINSESRISPSL